MTTVVTAVVLFVVALLMSHLQLYNTLSAEATSSTSSLKTASGAVVSRGPYPITMGSANTIHPGAAIIAEDGPIIIGSTNIIDDKAVIINRLPPGEKSSDAQVLIIGNNNIFKGGSHSEALKIGNNNILESGSFLGREVELTNNCIVGAACVGTCP
ncbi:dynactin subunit 6 [Anabrus simplex]|uniref:dynactin subunit 6 n=1 Tax=Anabrus simplex TaxID=316456 RepID=UPI0035A3B874